MNIRVLCCIALVLGLLSACDQQRIAKLEEGVSTEAQVREQFGDPLTEVEQPDGSRVLEYTRQPEGTTNYFITIGADGKMASLRQVLTEANFVRVRAGMESLEVRALIGRPGKVRRYAMSPGEVWEWRFADGNRTRIFGVTFDPSGRVLKTSIGDDTERPEGGKNQ